MGTIPQSNGRNTICFGFWADGNSVRCGSSVVLIVASCILKRRIHAEIMKSSRIFFILWRLCRSIAPDSAIRS